MQYMGNFTWQKENGKIAHVVDGEFISFGGKAVKTVPNYASELIVAVAEAGSCKDLETLFREVAPFRSISRRSASFKLYLQTYECLNREADYKDTAKERVAKVIANNEGISYMRVIMEYSRLIERLFSLGFGEKDLIATSNYIAKHYEGRKLKTMKSSEIVMACYRLKLGKFLPNNGNDIPQDQIQFVLYQLRQMEHRPNRTQEGAPSFIDFCLPAFATWIRNGQIRNALQLEKNEIYLGEMFRKCCVLAYDLGHEEVKANGNLMNKLADLFTEYEDRKDQMFRELVAKLAAKLCFEDDNYTVRLPQCEADFIREGKENHNCVGTFGYYKRMSEGKTFVVFVREKTNPDKAFITCEISPNGTIRQFYGRRNSNPNEAAKAFRRKYAAHLRETFNN